MKIEVFYKDKPTATAYIDGNDVRIDYYTDDQVVCLFPRKKMDMITIMECLETRCYPRNRQSIKRILKTLGLKEYNPLEICKITHGIMRNDYTWLRFDDEDIGYENVKIRG